MKLYNRTVLCGATLMLLRAAPALGLNLYVANFHNNSIQRFDSSGRSTVFANSGLHGPMGLAFDNAGNLYVGNWYANTIIKYDSGGNPSVFANSGLSNPRGLACDAAGNLYVANYNGNSVVRLDPSGHQTVF